MADTEATVAAFVFKYLESQIKEVCKQEEDVVSKTFTLLENYILRILTETRPKSQAVENAENYTVWNPNQGRLTNRGYGSNMMNYGRLGYGSNMMNYGRQAFQTMQNAFSSIMTKPAPAIIENPETFGAFQGDENVVQVEVLSRSGAKNVVKKIGLVGLKQLGDEFEPIANENPIEIPAFNP